MGSDGEPAGDPTPPRRRRRRILLWAAVGVGGLALVAVGLFLAFASPRDDEFLPGTTVKVWAQQRPDPDMPYYDGIVEAGANSRKLPLRLRNGRRVTLEIRKADLPYIDWQHALSHAQLGQPVRAYWRKNGDHKAVVILTDAPIQQ